MTRCRSKVMQDLTPQTPTELLTLMASTSTQIDVFSDGVIESVQRGEINPLTVLVQLRAMERASERILKEIRQNIMNEADKYPEKEFDFMGNKMTKTEHGTRYDYSGCGDPVFFKRYAIAKEANEQLKERESFLKAVKAPFSLLDEATGEVNVISPPTKTSTSGLNVSIR